MRNSSITLSTRHQGTHSDMDLIASLWQSALESPEDEHPTFLASLNVAQHPQHERPDAPVRVTTASMTVGRKRFR